MPQKSPGGLEAIWIKRSRRGPMDAKNSGVLVARKGLLGNADQGGKRQVTIIEKETWMQMRTQLKANLDPSTRRANLLVSGISLVKSPGRILQIGNGWLRIAGESKP
ncbi:MAG: hypothetical protein ACE5HS_21195 [bacterium]